MEGWISLEMAIQTLLNTIIIGLFLYVAVLSYSYYASSVVNHYRYRVLYSIAFLNVFQGVLAFNFIWFGIADLQPIRWMIFSMIEVLMLIMLLKNSKFKRNHELIITSLFLILVLFSSLTYSLMLNMLIVAILMGTACYSDKWEIRKWYVIAMASYSLTTVVPIVMGFTGCTSLLMGVIFATLFTIASKKIYNRERIDDELKKKINKEV